MAYGTFDEKSLLPQHHTQIGDILRRDIQRRKNRHRSHAAAAIPLASWMSLLPDNVPLASLSIPGTHDSAAYHARLPFVVTQSLDLACQLSSGIRYFDFRCGLVANELRMVHGRAILDLTLAAALEILYTFLDDNPTEALVVQIKQDRAPDAESTIPFHVAVSALMVTAASRWHLSPLTPTLGECRSRILLFRRFACPGALLPFISPHAGVDVTRWVDNPPLPFRIHPRRRRTGDPSAYPADLVIQDRYNPTPPAPLPLLVDEKFALVTQMLRLAAVDTNCRTWYVNFCSAYEFNVYYRATPKEVAVGGWWFGVGWVDGINPRLNEELKAEKGRRRRLGIVALDYLSEPEADLVGQVVATNFGPREGMRRVRSWWVILLAMLLLAVFFAGALLVLVHGPVSQRYCSPWLHACAGWRRTAS